jgi:hypothetical protein
MTKARKRWTGDLDKPIRKLPTSLLTHGGAITSENAEDFNQQAAAAIDDAIHKLRLKKLGLLADHYNVGAQNYLGIVRALIDEFMPRFQGGIVDLRKTYNAKDNKSLALALAVKYVRGFEYQPVILDPDVAVRVSDVETREAQVIIHGAIRSKLAEGRPEKWTPEQYQALLDSVTKIKGSGLSDLEALRRLRRRPPWNQYTLPTLENRLQDAKKAKKPRA